MERNLKDNLKVILGSIDDDKIEKTIRFTNRQFLIVLSEFYDFLKPFLPLISIGHDRFDDYYTTDLYGISLDVAVNYKKVGDNHHYYFSHQSNLIFNLNCHDQVSDENIFFLGEVLNCIIVGNSLGEALNKGHEEYERKEKLKKHIKVLRS